MKSCVIIFRKFTSFYDFEHTHIPQPSEKHFLPDQILYQAQFHLKNTILYYLNEINFEN